MWSSTLLDDIAYVRKDQAETSVLFELISSRYEDRSLLVMRRPQFSWTRIKGQSDVEGGGAWLGRGE